MSLKRFWNKYCLLWSTINPWTEQKITQAVPKAPPTIGLLNQAAVGVDASPTLVGFLLSQPQDVLQPVECHQNNLGVHDSQQVTQGLDTTQIHQVPAGREQHQHHCLPRSITFAPWEKKGDESN